MRGIGGSAVCVREDERSRAHCWGAGVLVVVLDQHGWGWGTAGSYYHEYGRNRATRPGVSALWGCDGPHRLFYQGSQWSGSLCSHPSDDRRLVPFLGSSEYEKSRRWAGPGF